MIKTIIRKINTARALSIRQWSSFIKAWVLMLYIRLRMDFSPFKTWKHWLTNDDSSPSKPLSDDELNLIIMHRRMIVLASRYHIINANCLPKSLSLKWILEKEEIATQLRLGLNTKENDFQGHAWLVHNDLVLNDSDDVEKRYPLKQQLEQKPLIN